LIDNEGVVRAKLYRPAFTQRHSTQELIEAAVASNNGSSFRRLIFSGVFGFREEEP